MAAGGPSGPGGAGRTFDASWAEMEEVIGMDLPQAGEALCEVCGDYGGAARMVVCESTDLGCIGGRHFYCFEPQIKDAEDLGDWYCSFCRSHGYNRPGAYPALPNSSAAVAAPSALPARISDSGHVRPSAAAAAQWQKRKERGEGGSEQQPSAQRRKMEEGQVPPGPVLGERQPSNPLRLQQAKECLSRPLTVPGAARMASAVAVGAGGAAAAGGAAPPAAAIRPGLQQPAGMQAPGGPAAPPRANGGAPMAGPGRGRGRGWSAGSSGRGSAAAVPRRNGFSAAMATLQESAERAEKRLDASRVHEERQDQRRKQDFEKTSAASAAALHRRRLAVDGATRNSSLWNGTLVVALDNGAAGGDPLPVVAYGLEGSAASMKAARKLPEQLQVAAVDAQEELGVALEECIHCCALVLAPHGAPARMLLQGLRQTGRVLRAELPQGEWVALAPHAPAGSRDLLLLALFVAPKQTWRRDLRPARAILKHRGGAAGGGGGDAEAQAKAGIGRRLAWPDGKEGDDGFMGDQWVVVPGPVYSHADVRVAERVVALSPSALPPRWAPPPEPPEPPLELGEGAEEGPSGEGGAGEPCAAEAGRRGAEGEASTSGRAAFDRMGSAPLSTLRVIGLGIDWNVEVPTPVLKELEEQGLRFLQQMHPGSVDMFCLNSHVERDGLESLQFRDEACPACAALPKACQLHRMALKEYVRSDELYCRFFSGAHRVMDFLARYRRLPSLAEGEGVGELHRAGVCVITDASALARQPQAFKQVVKQLEECRAAYGQQGYYAVKMQQSQVEQLRENAAAGDAGAEDALSTWQCADCTELLSRDQISRKPNSGMPLLVRNAVKVAHQLRKDCRHIVMMTEEAEWLQAGLAMMTIHAERVGSTVELLTWIAQQASKLYR